jgi:hypothetical protein
MTQQPKSKLMALAMLARADQIDRDRGIHEMLERERAELFNRRLRALEHEMRVIRVGGLKLVK